MTHQYKNYHRLNEYVKALLQGDPSVEKLVVDREALVELGRSLRTTPRYMKDRHNAKTLRGAE